MLTLDEVIALMEDERRCDAPMYKDDALHYLKKYRDNFDARNDQVERYQKAAKECEEILTDYVALKQYWAEQQSNEPLTWSELKQMEEKPVWIEFLNDDPWSNSWWVVGEVRKDDIIIAQYLDEAELCEDDLGEFWQAYRKERYEPN